mmetsp:Transcript_62886/g.178654  ORF Transcript_62886/g.178654 Transcript_62886/m.178654 type:complete len:206 (-) Transcript_62886:1508-2125(-)
MPMPTSALWIMLQSFAPSPTASVMAFSSRLINRTTAPFCLGETRQQITVLQFLHMATNSRSFPGSSATSRHFPSMTKPSYMRFIFAASRARSATMRSFLLISCGRNTPSTSKSEVVKTGRSPRSPSSGSKRPVAMPMLIAVSVLSPVSIQTRMPAAAILMMVLATSSWRRSSIPVIPCISRLVSISSATWSSLSCLSCVAQEASV